MEREVQIRYRSKKLEAQCTIATVGIKAFGLDTATKLQQRMQEIESAESVDFLIHYRIGRCHRLKGNRRNQVAMDLGDSFRLVFEGVEGECRVVKIIEIVDYH